MKVNKYLIFILGALGGLLYGYDNGTISGALLYIPKDIPLHNGAIEGLVVSSMLFGAIVGAGGSGPLSDRIGRRRLVLFIALVFIVGSLVLAFSTNIVMLIIGCIFAIFQQFIGINAVIFYAPTIFTKAGLGGSASIIGTVGIGVVNVLVTILALFIVDRVDRKKLLVIGNIGMIASLVIMAMLIWSIVIQSSAWIIIICLSLFIVFFGISWGPVLWVMLPELFPTRARGAATGIAALVLNFGTLIVAQLFPILNHNLDTEWVFLIFAAIGVLAMFFVIKYLPETRGRSLAEIERELRLRTGVKSE
ncbi:MFS transporter [Staphylococcus hominis]